MKNSDKKLHEKFQEYGRNAREWMRKCVLMLVEIDDNRIWEKKKFGSLREYVSKVSGMNKNTLKHGLRIMRRTVDMPHIRKVIEEKGIWIIRPIETILTVENEKFWAEKAIKMSHHVLEQYVRDMKKLDTFECHVAPKNAEISQQQAISNFGFGGEAGVLPLENFTQELPPKTLVPMELSPEVLQKLEKLKGQNTWNELFAHLLQEREEQLEKEKPKAVKTDSRYIPTAIENFVIKRTLGTCGFPKCSNEFDEIHHTERFSLTHEHDPDKLEALCETHHALAHHGLIDNEDCPAQNWKIRLQPDSTQPKFAIDLLVQKRSMSNARF